MATNITIPTAGLFKAVGDNGDAVYSFDANGVPTSYSLAQSGQPANNYTANLSALSSYGIDWNSLPTFNKADIDQRLISQGKVGSNGMPTYNGGGGLTDLATLKGIAPTTTTNQINTDPSIQGYVNPNAGFQATGSTAGFTNNVTQTGQYPAQVANQGGANANTAQQNAQVNGTTPVGQQTPEQAAATEAATGQKPVPQGQTAATQGTIQPPNVALQPGNTGDAVKQLQDWLVSQGYMTPEQVATGPGIYGPQTTAAVAALQQKLGVDNTSGPGYFGPKTQAAISQMGTQNGQINPSGLTTGGQGTVAPSTTNTPDTTDPYAALDPVQKQVKMYTEAYNALGLSDIKTQYEKIMKDEADLQNELADKISDINANPWYSEGVRVKEIQKMQDKYETRLAILTNTAQLMDSLYKQGLGQVENIVSGAQADIAAANALAQKQIDAEAKLNELDTQVVEAGGRKILINSKTGKQIADLGAASSGSSGGLSSAQLNSTINQIVGSFDNEQIVKDYNTVNGYVNTFDTLGYSASDDQARIYAFAKVMDPNSVVRESEYKTVQEYSQALLQAAGINLARVFTATGALSPDARTAMSKTLHTKLTTQQGLYKNLYNQYQNRIQQASSGGFNSLPDYSQAFGGTSLSTASQPTTITKDHIMYAVDANGDLTPIGSAL